MRTGGRTGPRIESGQADALIKNRKNVLWEKRDCNVLDFLEFQRVSHVDDFGTISRHSSCLAFGRSTGNEVSGHYKCHYFFSFF